MAESNRVRRFAASSGDTWHPSLASAREQVGFEHEDAIGEWIHVPKHVDDAHVYAIRYAAEQLSSSED